MDLCSTAGRFSPSPGRQCFRYIRGNCYSHGTSLPFLSAAVQSDSYSSPKPSVRTLSNKSPSYSCIGSLCMPIVSVRPDLLSGQSANSLLDMLPINIPCPSLPSHPEFHCGRGLLAWDQTPSFTKTLVLAFCHPTTRWSARAGSASSV